jgi:hypothetical protein
MKQEATPDAKAISNQPKARGVAKPYRRCGKEPKHPKAATTQARRLGNFPTPADPPLIRVLLREAMRRPHRLNDLAAELGVTYGYISQLRTGLRRTEHISHEFATSCGRYLGVPPVLVKLWAGRIRAEDFVWPGKPVAEAIESDFDMMASDPMILGLLPEDLRGASQEVKQFVVNLYFEATTGWPGRTLRSLPAALDLLQRAALNEADFEAQLSNFREELSCAA